MPDEPVAHPVPGTLAHARCVIAWEGRLLPLLDAGALLSGNADDWGEYPTAATSSLQNVVAIVAYTPRGPAAAEAELGALLLRRLPERVEVADEQACDLPAPWTGWGSLFVSCFEHPEHGPVPILDLAALFAPPELQRAAS
jgi:hypothetical protein